MRRFARTGTKVVVFAAIAVTALAACSKSSTSTQQSSVSGFQGIPTPSAKHVAGGTVTFGMPAGATPNYILPITPGANSSVYTSNYFQNQFWRPVYWTPVGHALNISYPLSLASAPSFTNANKTVTIKMKTNYKWSSGASVDAQDLVFFIDLVKAAVKISPANYGNFSPGFFPDNVATATATSKFTLTLNLTKPYNPGYFLLDQLNLLTPLPSASWDVTAAGGKPASYTTLAGAEKIYKFLNAQSLKLSTYATNPLWQVVDGPFKLSAFNPSTDANTMVVNPTYGGQKPSITKFQEVAFTSDSAEFTDLQSGGLTVGLVPSTDIPQIPALRKHGFNVFGFPDFGFDYMPFNFKNTTNHWSSVIGQLYVRQALAHLVDSAGYIKGIFHGYAAVAAGPVPSVPQSPFTPANAVNAPYPFSISAAKSTLAAHGWKIVGGTTQTCEKPGTAAADCGAGIPKGTKLSFTLVFNNGSPAATAEDTAFASDAKGAGVPVTLVGKSFNFILANYYNVAAPANIDKWQVEDFGGFTQSLYPTTNTIFNTAGTFNIGSYSDPKADTLINASVFGAKASAVKAEASYLTTHLPALFQPDSDHVYAWKTDLSGPQASFWELPQFSLNPELWYFTGK